MRYLDCRATDQTFTHVDKETRAVLMINASALNRKLDALQYTVVAIELNEVDADYIAKNHGVEPDRLNRITASDLRAPVTFIEWGDGSHLLVDGNHRYVQAWVLGRKTILSRLATQDIWREFIVQDVPAEIAAAALADVLGQI